MAKALSFEVLLDELHRQCSAVNYTDSRLTLYYVFKVQLHMMSDISKQLRIRLTGAINRYLVLLLDNLSTAEGLLQTVTNLKAIYRMLYSAGYSGFQARWLSMKLPKGFDVFLQLTESVVGRIGLTNKPEEKEKLYKQLGSCIVFPCRSTLAVSGLEDKALQSYLENEYRLKSVDFDPTIIQGLRKIVTAWFKDFDFSNFKPHHGNGATFELKRPFNNQVAKYSVMDGNIWCYKTATYLDSITKSKNFTSILCEYRDINILSWQYDFERDDYILSSSIREIIPDNDLIDYIESNHDHLSADYFVSKPISRVTFVPKSIDSLRTVSAESTELIFWQQGLREAVYHYIDKHPFLKSRMNVNRQDRNRKLCKLGSKYFYKQRSYATIDYSKASDSISARLVEEVFKDVVFGPLLQWLRSDITVLPDGEKHLLEMFAPMGSAMSFFVETIIFAAVDHLSYYRFLNGQIDDGLTGFELYDYSVFGDDNVVQSDIAPTVYEIGSMCGFLINQDKSYMCPSPYRESCGIESYAGLDVTPIKVSRKFCLDSHIDVGTNLYGPNLYKARRRRVLACIRQKYGNAINFSTIQRKGQYLTNIGCFFETGIGSIVERFYYVKNRANLVSLYNRLVEYQFNDVRKVISNDLIRLSTFSDHNDIRFRPFFSEVGSAASMLSIQPTNFDREYSLSIDCGLQCVTTPFYIINNQLPLAKVVRDNNDIVNRISYLSYWLNVEKDDSFLDGYEMERTILNNEIVKDSFPPIITTEYLDVAHITLYTDLSIRDDEIGGKRYSIISSRFTLPIQN